MRPRLGILAHGTTDLKVGPENRRPGPVVLTHSKAMGSARIEAGVTRGTPFGLTLDGAPIEAFPGETVATALLAAHRRTARHTAHRGAPRGVFCAIGVCHDCRMVVDGVENVRTCLVAARPGMVVETQQGFGRVPDPSAPNEPR